MHIFMKARRLVHVDTNVSNDFRWYQIFLSNNKNDFKCSYLRQFHVPSSFSNLILDYYNNFNLRVTSGTKTSDWHRLERGIITGCTISATLFSLAMNMIIKSAEVECRGPRVKSGTTAASIESLHGRYYSDNIISHRL